MSLLSPNNGVNVVYADVIIFVLACVTTICLKWQRFVAYVLRWLVVLCEHVELKTRFLKKGDVEDTCKVEGFFKNNFKICFETNSLES